jgi:hypothetical protein
VCAAGRAARGRCLGALLQRPTEPPLGACITALSAHGANTHNTAKIGGRRRTPRQQATLSRGGATKGTLLGAFNVEWRESWRHRTHPRWDASTPRRSALRGVGLHPQQALHELVGAERDGHPRHHLRVERSRKEQGEQRGSGDRTGHPPTRSALCSDGLRRRVLALQHRAAAAAERQRLQRGEKAAAGTL